VATGILVGSASTDERFYKSLPREYYLSAERFEQEYARVFARQWLMVGHECQVPNPGDYFTVDIAGENIIVTRTDAGEVHAMYNVCRHRGSRVCDAATGHVTSFVCPYHAWSYAPDGTLEGAPTMPDGEYIDYSEYGLKPVHVDSWGGFVFIHLGEDEPSSLAAAFAQMSDKLPVIPVDGIKLVHEVVHDLEANWKLVAENNLECYHCGVCHDALCGAADLESFKADIATAARYAVQDRNFIGGSGPGIAIRRGASSMTTSGDFACKKLLGGLKPEQALDYSAGFHIAPLFGAALFYADYIVVQTNFPVSVNQTKQKIQWFVRADATEGVDYATADVIGVLDQTAREDVAIIERNGRGAASRSYTPGPLSKTAEPINHLMLTMYLEWMGE
jgi:Rieske 2Fe-2S family protein